MLTELVADYPQTRSTAVAALSRDDFEKLALERRSALDRVARSMTRTANEADDLVQETYLRALQGWTTFDLRGHGIRPWLLRILHNSHVTRSMREARQPQPVEFDRLQAVAGPAPHRESAALYSTYEELDAAMFHMSPELRCVLRLWAVENLSYQEIADTLMIPIGTVMSRLHRARNYLKGMLRDLPEHGDTRKH